MRRKAQISFLSNSRGASLVEYILLLVVSISLVVTLTRLFWQPFNGFLDAYVGGYTQCLLEVGELPVLGGETNVEDLEECRARLSEAQEKLASEGGSSDRSTPERSARSRRDPTERNREDAARASSASGRSRGGSIGGQSRGTQGSGDREDGKTSVVILNPDQGSKFFRSNRTGGESTIARTVAQQGKSLTFFPNEQEREQLERLKKARKPATESIGTVNQANKKMKIEAQQKKKTDTALEKGFDLSFFLRLLFVLAILILIFILLGGFILQVRQTMQSKS